MINFNYKKEFSKIVRIASLISLVSTFILVPIYKQNGTALTVVIVETFIVIKMHYFLRKQSINLFDRKYFTKVMGNLLGR